MCVYINKKLQENNMSIADEFKLKKIPKANYSPNKRTIINTKTCEVHVQKKAVKVVIFMILFMFYVSIN